MNIHQSNQNDFPQPKITIDVLKKEMIQDLLFAYPNWVVKGSEQEKDIIRIWFMGALTALVNPKISNPTIKRKKEIHEILDSIKLLFTDLHNYKIDDSFRPAFTHKLNPENN